MNWKLKRAIRRERPPIKPYVPGEAKKRSLWGRIKLKAKRAVFLAGRAHNQ